MAGRNLDQENEDDEDQLANHKPKTDHTLLNPQSSFVQESHQIVQQNSTDHNVPQCSFYKIQTPCSEIKDASQNGSEDNDTIYINLSNMDGSASSPLAMLHTARAKVNGLNVKILIEQGSNLPVATKNV